MGSISKCYCKDFEKAYKRYRNLRLRPEWPEILDKLEFKEVKILLMLTDSMVEGKCQFCDKELNLFGKHLEWLYIVSPCQPTTILYIVICQINIIGLKAGFDYCGLAISGQISHSGYKNIRINFFYFYL